MPPFRAYRVHRDQPDAEVRAGVERVSDDLLPDHDVTVRVSWSSLNYKDALAARGHPGVARQLPHTPGVDAAGEVIDSRDPRFRPGDAVICTSYGLGVEAPGGFGARIRVPGDWLVPMPKGLAARTAMDVGTAGLTAALALGRVERHGLTPDDGPVLVTGASGGVGSLAVALFASAGWEVVAATGKRGARGWLRELGAAEVLGREAYDEAASKPMVSAHWGAIVDVLGGEPLARLVKALRPGGAAVVCGLVAGADVPLTVYPLILRGVALLGVDSAGCPMPERLRAWRRWAAEDRPRHWPPIAEAGLDELDGFVERMLAGEVEGRVRVRVGD